MPETKKRHMVLHKLWERDKKDNAEIHQAGPERKRGNNLPELRRKDRIQGKKENGRPQYICGPGSADRRGKGGRKTHKMRSFRRRKKEDLDG